VIVKAGAVKVPFCVVYVGPDRTGVDWFTPEKLTRFALISLPAEIVTAKVLLPVGGLAK
jgi:hypothetical protein